nr:LOW QUALITY PROTEIN: protocadherin alpha-13 [Vicugna pacos]
MVFSWQGGFEARQLLLWFLLLAVREWGSGQVHYSVPEEAKHGTFVGRIAQDLGLELVELVPRLFRVASKGRGDLLEVNLQNGILFVNSRIDREELCGRSAECSIHLEVIVDRPLQVFHVEVEVKDINDNPPVFREGEQKVLVSESAPLESRFPLEGASDADMGLNSLLTYRLSLNEYFTLKIVTKTDKSILPELILRKTLDREEMPELNMLLTALDGGKPQLTGSVQIHITILDVNDNAPEFDKPSYKVLLFENVPNDTRVIQLNASDLDEGPNRDISYGIRMILPMSEKCMFSINPETGEIRIYGKLDFEENNEYEIQVKAIDKGIPSMAGHCTVLVQVLDLNDNTPEVTVTSLSLPVREDAQVGTVIVVYILQISLKVFECTMLISWRGGPGAPRLLLSLLLLAVWEAGSGQVHYSVPEEAKHGTFVGRIAQDLGLELAELVPRLFRVASKGRGDLLEVNLQNGILFVNSRIDREELCGRSAECSIHLEVIVDRPLQVFHVEVEVTDINDNPPVFPESEKRIIIAESRPPETRFPLDGASDADIGVNSALTYRVYPNDYFTLDTQNNREQTSSLSLVLRKSLDREEIQEHSLLLTASDGGKPELTGTVQLMITILDVNDNAPDFDQLIYKVRVLESTVNGTLVIKLNATDPDDGTNGDIIYSFRRPVSPAILYAFSINPDNGEVRTKGKLDFEEKKLYEIPVEAVDKGNIPMAGHCTILVEVLDINDNAPEVTITSLALPVREDAQVGTVIALISVSDPDSGANGQVTCSLTPQVPFKLVSTFKNYYSLVLDSVLDPS